VRTYVRTLAASHLSIPTVRSHSLDVSVRVAARSKLILLISSPARLQPRLSHCRPIRATTPPTHAIPLISVSLMRWPSRNGTREVSADITMRRDVSRISPFSARRTRSTRNKNERTQERKKALCTPPGGITQLRSFPSELFLRFYRGR